MTPPRAPPTLCPLCGGPSRATFSTGDRNWAVTDRSFTYAECATCGTFHLQDVPSDLQDYYPTSYYNLMALADLDRAAAGEGPKLELLLRFGRVGSLLEIGPGFGVFARAAKRAGYEVTAVEMDERCCRYLGDVVGVRAVHSDKPEVAVQGLGRFNAIVLWHVIEHVPDPALLLEHLANRLAPGGLLVVATPNPEALQFRLLGSRWAHVDAPRHRFLIPARTLIARAHGLGLDVVHLTSADPAGRRWNRFGWDYAIRRRPAARSPSVLSTGLSVFLSVVLRRLEGRDLNGATYTVVFTRRNSSSRAEG